MRAASIPEPSLVIKDWYDYMAAYLKSVDPNHMVGDPVVEHNIQSFMKEAESCGRHYFCCAVCKQVRPELLSVCGCHHR